MSTTAEIDLARVSLADPTLWASGPPYALFRRLQHEAPVHYSRPVAGQPGFWSITRHEDVQAVTRDFRGFASPRHDRLKRLVADALAPDALPANEQAVRTVIEAALDTVASQPHFDLVADLAAALPARAIGTLGPADELIAALLATEVEGEHLTADETEACHTLLLSTGAESTRSTYCATMLALLRNPKQFKLLVDRPDVMDRAVEEGLRCFPAFPFVVRWATADVELHGRTMRANDRVLLWYLASNRDESVFVRPQQFDITRDELDRHQTFGARGRRVCVGAGLARLNLRLWLAGTLSRFPGLELDGRPTRTAMPLLDRLDSIPVSRGLL